MGFFKTLFTGYKLMFQDINRKHNDLFPRAFSGCGTGLMLIGSAVMAKHGTKEDVQKAIADANAAVEASKARREGETKATHTKRIFKAKVVKGLKIAKVYRKGIAMEIGGAVLNGIGYKMAENGKHTALKAAGSLAATLASYRACVREDLGEEADARYMSGRRAYKKTEKIDRKTGEVTNELEKVEDDGVIVKKDPNSFRLLFSPESCPSLCSENYHLRLDNLKYIEDTLTRKLQAVGHISLNDMRREFGGLIPAKMDVDEGGIFGIVLDPNIPKYKQRVNLHHRDDVDFMEGRKNWCYVIFDCDVIIGKINKNIKQMEN